MSGWHRFRRTGVVAEECFKQHSRVNKVNLIVLISSGFCPVVTLKPRFDHAPIQSVEVWSPWAFAGVATG